MSDKTLNKRLGGYEGITSFVEDLLSHLEEDQQLGRFWQHRGGGYRERNNYLSTIYV
jgi:hemoglobin